MKPKSLFCLRQFHCAFCIMLAGLLTIFAGCIVEPAPEPVYVPPSGGEVVGVEGGLIYYPDYEVYYDPALRVYWFPRGGVWVTGPRPPGVSIRVLLASPHVRMDFRDSPANHHAEVVRRYPHGWRPDRR